MSTPYEGFHDFVAGVPDLLQPILVAAAGTVPYIEGEGSAAFGVIAGLNPLVAGWRVSRATSPAWCSSYC